MVFTKYDNPYCDGMKAKFSGIELQLKAWANPGGTGGPDPTTTLENHTWL